MKILVTIVCCLSIGACSNILTKGLPQEYTERMHTIERESYNTIDKMFIRVCTAVLNKEEMSDTEWFKYLKDNGIGHLLSDARIHSFDSNVDNIIPEKIDAYLRKKIGDEMKYVVAHDVDIKGVKQFLATATMLCFLSEGSDCKALIRTIKNENKSIIHALKKRKESEQKEACLARENILVQSKK